MFKLLLNLNQSLRISIKTFYVSVEKKNRTCDPAVQRSWKGHTSYALVSITSFRGKFLSIQAMPLLVLIPLGVSFYLYKLCPC